MKFSGKKSEFIDLIVYGITRIDITRRPAHAISGDNFNLVLPHRCLRNNLHRCNMYVFKMCERIKEVHKQNAV